MNNESLDIVPIWLVFVALCGFTALALEGGYRFGKWRRDRSVEEKDTPVGAIVGSILGLLAFFLAFTFGMAGSRFESRRQAVLDEANAIGTTYLRAHLLPEPQRTESAKLLREYVDVRISGVQQNKVAMTITRSEELHDKLWAQAAKAADSHPTPITGLYIQSLNQMIDMHATRIQAGLRSRIPTIIWAGLFTLTILSMASVGYQAGLSATRRSPAMVGLVLAFAGVLVLIADLDRPGEGLVTVSQQSMLDLQKTMNAERR